MSYHGDVMLVTVGGGAVNSDVPPFIYLNTTKD